MLEDLAGDALVAMAPAVMAPVLTPLIATQDGE